MLDTVCHTELPLWGWWRPRAPALHHTAVLTLMYIFFLECRAGCSCFIVLIRFDFYRMSLMGWENCKSLCVSVNLHVGSRLGGFSDPLGMSVPDRPGSTQAGQYCSCPHPPPGPLNRPDPAVGWVPQAFLDMVGIGALLWPAWPH